MVFTDRTRTVTTPRTLRSKTWIHRDVTLAKRVDYIAAMRSRLSPVLLGAWLIMEPPLVPLLPPYSKTERPIFVVQNDGYLARYRADVDAPLTAWKQVGGADTLSKCEEVRRARAPVQREWGKDRIKVTEPDLRPFSRCVPAEQIYPASK